MLAVFGCLCGIFVGIATAGYMLIQQIRERDTAIDEKTNDFIQLNEENISLRNELEETKFDLSVANREIKLQDKQIQHVKTILEQNNYGRDDIKIAKLKEVITTANVK